MTPDTFRCFLVKKTGKDRIETSIERRPLFELPAGDVLIRVAYSSLNYKDALAVQGHPAVARHFPHVPGIDAAGTVVESSSSKFHAGDSVLVTSYELGVERWGGWAELIRVPAEWIVRLPESMTLEESMLVGTAGLTAGLCLRALERHDVRPDGGEVVVTGATGGVGILAVHLLATLGYSVVAVSGKPQYHALLRELGAQRVLGRVEILDDSNRPLLASQYAGAIDTVGGQMLASLLRRMQNNGCVSCCGLVGGADLSTTVYPFILRGVTLSGIDSAWCDLTRRIEVWNRLAKLADRQMLHRIATTSTLESVGTDVANMLAGKVVGRVVIRL